MQHAGEIGEETFGNENCGEWNLMGYISLLQAKLGVATYMGYCEFQAIMPCSQRTNIST